MTDINALIAQYALPAAGPDHLDYILVDGSSSMADKWWNLLTAADIILDDVRKSTLDPHTIVHVFDNHDLALIQRDAKLSECKSFAEEPLTGHFGMTPLYDAINLMGYRLSQLRPLRASILIITDGEDNTSTMAAGQARAVLNWCRANGWSITFLGCDFNNSRQAKELGIDESNAIGVAQAKLSDAAANFAAKRIRYAHTGNSVSFNEDERKNFGGYLK